MVEIEVVRALTWKRQRLQPGTRIEVPPYDARRFVQERQARIVLDIAQYKADDEYELIKRPVSWPVNPYSRIGKLAWHGMTAVIIGAGPSLTAADAEYVQRVRDSGERLRIIATNRSLELLPRADVHYFCDERFWEWYSREPWITGYRGTRVTLENINLAHRDQTPQVHCLYNAGTTGLSDAQDALCTGANSGYQAMNFAILAGVRRVVLLGFDMGAASNGAKHWHAEHPVKTSDLELDLMRRRFAEVAPLLAARNIEVINASRQTALTVFPQAMLEAAIPPY